MAHRLRVLISCPRSSPQAIECVLACCCYYQPA